MTRRIPWRRALLSCVVMGLAACADDYPAEDGALVLTYGMSREATLTAMNTIGHQDYLEQHWHYEVDEACRLLVRSEALEGNEALLPAAKPGLTARVVATDDDRSHQVFVHASGAAAQAGHLVLEGANEFDAGQMRWLMEYLGTACRP